jgi:photosynthesis system II assembly factor YCF48-like protein/putative zinc finger protein
VTEALSNVPKIVHERLRAAAPEKAWPEGVPRAHPDPDLLAAFAEQALPPAEREGVLGHLALCGDCREVIAVALPAAASVSASEISAQADDARAVSARPQRNWFVWSGFTWHRLRWGALAAGIVVAGAIILNQSKKPNQPLEARHQVETVIREPATTPSAKPAAPAQANSEFGSTAEIKPRQKLVGSQPNPQLNRRLLNKESRVVADLRTAPVEAALAAGTLQAPARKKDLFGSAAAASPGATSPPVPSVSGTVKVSGASAAVNTQDALIARNEVAPAISKAKAAVPAMDEAAAPPKSAPMEMKGASAVNRLARADAVSLRQAATIAAQWEISSGALQRSLDRGVTWQTSLRSERPLLCFAARANEVWAGGKAGVLFHSADGGANWTQVNPSADGRALGADVTRIEARSPTEIVLSTSSSESWTTLDGGKTWAKK